MSDAFSIDRKRSKRAPVAAGTDPGATEWDLNKAAPEAAIGWDASHDARETPQPQATEPAAATLAPFRDLMDDDEEERSSLPGIDIRRLLLGCWRRRIMVGAIACAFILVFGVVAFTTIENEWTAVATLIKRDTGDEFAIGGGKAFKPQQYNLKTLLDTLKLPSSLDKVIERAELDMKRTELSGVIDVKLGNESEIMHLIVNWQDPQTAAVIANHLADVFLERSSTMRQVDAEETYLYFNERLEETRAERREIDAEMLAFQQENKLSDFDAETEARLGELARLEGEYQSQLAEIGALQFSIERLDAEITEQPDMIIKSTIYRSPLKQRLADYEWELQESRSRYTSDNPKVAKLQKKVDVLTRMISDSNDESVPENTYSPNGHRLNLDMRLHELRDNLKVTEGRSEAMRTTIEKLQQKLAFLSSKEKEFVRLKLRQEASESLEFSLTHRVDEARLQMLRSEAAFDILERATPPEERQPSGRKLLVAGGAVVGVGLGLLAALLLEFFDPRVRTRRDGSDLSGAVVCSEWARLPASGQQSVTPDPATSPATMTFRHFINNLEAQHGAEQLHSIAVVSTERGAGRSLIAANLARTLAMKERPTLLVDADPGTDAGRRPHESCAASGSEQGLLQTLDGSTTLQAALMKTDLEKLHCLGPGHAVSKQPASLVLGGKRMMKFISALRRFRGRVIYDLPALQGHETALEAAAAIGNVVLVLRSGWSRRADTRQLVALLQQRHINILGTLVIDMPEHYLEYNRPAAQHAGAGNTTYEDNQNAYPDALQNA
jgi:succinoglycan biosynthesis transport protein ExoP